MSLKHLNGAVLPATADFHVHLRDGKMMELVVPTIRSGGVNTVMVMPNLVPPITTVSRALEYRKQLQSIDPDVKYLMSLYLHLDVTPDTVREAAAAGIINVKSYPAGVTTNSSAGVVDYTTFYPVFEEMERQHMILNLHGECPSSCPDRSDGVTVLNAETSFLPTLKSIHKRFPHLRIVFEHCSTAAAVEAVKECGPTVAATITAHHLSLVVDNWAGDPFCFCKPVAKLPSDRDALLRAAVSGSPKFFFGSDSAPHPASAKRGGDTIAAGVFTQPYATQFVLDALERGVDRGVLDAKDVTTEKLAAFLSVSGRRFYKIDDPKGERITIKGKGPKVTQSLKSPDTDIEVVPFCHGEITWDVQWVR